MISGFDNLSFEIFKVLTSPLSIITAIGGVLIWFFIVGLIFSIILKKYSFLDYPISNWPNCGFVAAIIFTLITIVLSLIGFRPLSYGISVVLATIVILLMYEFAIHLKKLIIK